MFDWVVVESTVVPIITWCRRQLLLAFFTSLASERQVKNINISINLNITHQYYLYYLYHCYLYQETTQAKRLIELYCSFLVNQPLFEVEKREWSQFLFVGYV